MVGIVRMVHVIVHLVMEQTIVPKKYVWMIVMVMEYVGNKKYINISISISISISMDMIMNIYLCMIIYDYIWLYLW